MASQLLPIVGDVIASVERKIVDKKKKGNSSMVVLFSQKLEGGDRDAYTFKKHFEELHYSVESRKCNRHQTWDITIEW